MKLINWDIDIYPNQKVILYFVEKEDKSLLYKIKNISTDEYHGNTKEICDSFFTTSLFALVIPIALIIAYFLSSISIIFVSFIIYFIGRMFLKRRFFNVIKNKRINKESSYKYQ
ncbi:hypothetical protein LOV73_004680 [Salmonella enterica]|nr:hypothetical protein [Salmonella enterica]